MALGVSRRSLCPCPAGWAHHLAHPCTTCRAVFTVLPHFILRYRRYDPRSRALPSWPPLGASVELCAVLYHISPLALYRLICAFGRQSLVPVLTRCGLPLPVYFLADEKHSRCLTAKVYLPTIVSGRLIWQVYTTAASTAAFTQPYRAFQQAALQRNRRIGSAASSPMALTARRAVCGRCSLARLGTCLRHAQ